MESWKERKSVLAEEVTNVRWASEYGSLRFSGRENEEERAGREKGGEDSSARTLRWRGSPDIEIRHSASGMSKFRAEGGPGKLHL